MNRGSEYDKGTLEPQSLSLTSVCQWVSHVNTYLGTLSVIQVIMPEAVLRQLQHNKESRTVANLMKHISSSINNKPCILQEEKLRSLSLQWD